jgi:hypothetical protein
MMRVALYVRVSTPHQAHAQSIEQQVTRLRAAAQQRGWAVEEGHIYRDDYPATMAAEEVSRRARAVARRYVQEALPGLDPQPESELQCTSNRTSFADGDGFGAAQGGAVTVVYGNNLFKFAPLLGDLLAHAVVHQELPAALRTWTLARD